MLELRSKLHEDGGALDNLFKRLYPDSQNSKSFRHFITFLTIFDEVRSTASDHLEHISKIRTASTDGLNALENYIAQCSKLKSSWLGYHFKGGKIAALNQNLASSLPHDFEQPHNQLEQLKIVLSVFKHGQQLKTAQELSRSFEFKADFNACEYHTEQHVYREKVLESYGYKFLRINRFNVGKDPVETLSRRIEALVKKKDHSNHALVTAIHNKISGLKTGRMKECPQCKTIKPLEDFKSSDLITGYGRHCKRGSIRAAR
jgi:hypothetical protein